MQRTCVHFSYTKCEFFCVAKLPKWFGERPGKKKGEPESPEEEEVKVCTRSEY